MVNPFIEKSCTMTILNPDVKVLLKSVFIKRLLIMAKRISVFVSVLISLVLIFLMPFLLTVCILSMVKVVLLSLSCYRLI